jgi:hypothetical protein
MTVDLPIDDTVINGIIRIKPLSISQASLIFEKIGDSEVTDEGILSKEILKNFRFIEQVLCFGIVEPKIDEETVKEIPFVTAKYIADNILGLSGFETGENLKKNKKK